MVDAGFGSGRNLVYLLRSGYEVYGVDADRDAVEYTRNMAAAIAPALPQNNFRLEAIENMTFPNAFADVLV